MNENVPRAPLAEVIGGALKIMVNLQVTTGMIYFPWEVAYQMMKTCKSFYQIMRPCLYTCALRMNDVTDAGHFGNDLIELFSRLEQRGWNFQLNQGAGWIELARIEDLDRGALRTFYLPDGNRGTRVTRRVYRIKWPSPHRTVTVSDNVCTEERARVAHWWCRNIFVGLERTAFAILNDSISDSPKFYLEINNPSDSPTWITRISGTVAERLYFSDVYNREKELYADLVLSESKKSRVDNAESEETYFSYLTDLEQCGLCFSGEYWENLDWLVSPLMYAFCVCGFNVTLSYGQYDGFLDPHIPDWFNFGLELSWDGVRRKWQGVLNFSKFYEALMSSEFYRPLYQLITSPPSFQPPSPWSILFEKPINIFRQLYRPQLPFPACYGGRPETGKSDEYGSLSSLNFERRHYLFDAFIRNNLKHQAATCLEAGESVDAEGWACWPSPRLPHFDENLLYSLALYHGAQRAESNNDLQMEEIDYSSVLIHVQVRNICYNLTALQLALCFGDLELVTFLLNKKGCCPNQVYLPEINATCRSNTRVVSALGITMMINRFDLTQLLCKHGANVNIHQNCYGMDPILHKLFGSCHQIVSTPNLNDDDQVSSPGFFEIADILLAHGASLMETDTTGNTLLHVIFERSLSYENIEESVSWTIDRLCNDQLMWQCSQLNDSNETVFQCFMNCVRYRCLPSSADLAIHVFEKLLNCFAKGQGVLSGILNQGANIRTSVLDKMTDIYLPPQTKIEMTKLFLHYGARLLVLPWDLDPPELITLYLDYGHDPMRCDEMNPLEGHSPFFECAAYGTIAALERFVSHPHVNVNAMNSREWTVLFFLVHFTLRVLFVVDDRAANDLIFRIELLIRYGANVNIACPFTAMPDRHAADDLRYITPIELVNEALFDYDAEGRGQKKRIKISNFNYERRLNRPRRFSGDVETRAYAKKIKSILKSAIK